MFGISLPELLIIFAIVLIFIGPDKLPEVARKLGKMMADFKRSSDSVRKEFYNSVYAPANEIKGEIRRELTAVKSQIDTKIIDDHEVASPGKELDKSIKADTKDE